MNGNVWLNVEEKILAANAAQEAESFMALYDRYFNRVYNYVRYRCYDPQVADDITAQSFLKALSRISTYNPDKAPFGAWLFAIVRNLVSDYYRHEKKYNLVDIEDVEYIVQPQENRGIEESAEQREEKMKMLQALDKLPTRQRDLIALKFGSEMTNREIAQLAGLTEQNVGVLVHRGIKTLRKHLEEGEK